MGSSFCSALLLTVPVLLLAYMGSRHGVGPFDEARGTRMPIASTWKCWPRCAGGRPCTAAGPRRSSLVIDDALGWHEQGGAWLNQALGAPAPFGLRAQDVGELVTWGGIGEDTLVVGAFTKCRSSAAARRDAWRLAGLFAVILIPAVGVDMLHEMLLSVSDSSRLDPSLMLVEAAGEFTVMAALAAYAYHVWRGADSLLS